MKSSPQPVIDSFATSGELPEPARLGRRVARALVFLTAAWVCAWEPAPARAQADNDDCLWCHGDPSIAEMAPVELAGMVRPVAGRRVLRRAEDVGRLYTPSDAYEHSAHGALACVDCHQGVDRLPHHQRVAAVPCGDCHAEQAREVASGQHNTPSKENGLRRPLCGDCHGRTHEIPHLATPRTYAAAVQSVKVCLKCHDKSRTGGPDPGPTYFENAHGDALLRLGLSVSATCVDCHGAHAVLPTSDVAGPLHPLRVPQTCGRCHEGIEDTYFASVHGLQLAEGNTDAATCTTCHGSHGIRHVTEPFLTSVVEECSHCHLELGRTYLASYHGKATSLGDQSVAVCSSCHGAHDILPRSDPRSRVAPQNLVATCGRCHPDANPHFVEYVAHVDHTDPDDHPAVYYTWLVMTILLLSVLAFFVPHSLLWFGREGIQRLVHPHAKHTPSENERWVQRFRPVHRWTHFLIIVSFMGLVATGFPLKYSYTEWARDLTDFFGGVHFMGDLHRAFAILTFVYAGLHLSFLVRFFVKDCPRPRYKFLFGPGSMLFSLRDIKDFFAMMRWFFLLGRRPKFDRWTYFEKFDYWGEIWGILVIGGSGMILWFPTFFTRWLPGWILNCAVVVHSIEALLAASVIFLVHFLNTHLRPDKFPVDMVMLTGCMPESEMKEERGSEYERLVATGEIQDRIVAPVKIHWRILGRIAGVLAFACGLALIALALVTEFENLFIYSP